MVKGRGKMFIIIAYTNIMFFFTSCMFLTVELLTVILLTQNNF